MSSSLAVRPAYRVYRARVVSAERAGEHFARIRFGADDFAYFGTAGVDQRIKLIFPYADGTFADYGQDEPDDNRSSWYATWRELPADRQNVFRTYTVRRVDPEAREVTIDFVLHHDPGPAGDWAAAAAVGDELLIVGPDERSPDSRQGIDWHPGTATRVLLVGDETAAPAISGILEKLDARFTVDAFVEVPTDADALEVDSPHRDRIQWVARDDRSHGEALIDAVQAWTARSADVLTRAAAPRPQVLEDVDLDEQLIWESPEESDGEFYAWIAGEATVVKTLRRLLVSECGVDRRRVAFMGYWRLGQSERTE